MTTFRGDREELGNYIYDLTNDKAGVQYTKTTERIARFASSQYKELGIYVQTAIECKHNT